MPVVKLHLVKGKTREHKQAVMQAVQAGLISAFQITAKDVTQFLSEYAPEDVDGKGPDFTYVEVIALAGRSKDAKRKLYRAVVDNLCAATDLKPTDVLITLYEIPPDNNGVRGGQMASEIELGIKLDV